VIYIFHKAVSLRTIREFCLKLCMLIRWFWPEYAVPQ